MTWIFKCKKGHEYESKESICTFWAETNQSILDRIFHKWKANDHCKYCNSQIESCMHKTKPMGAVRI